MTIKPIMFLVVSVTVALAAAPIAGAQTAPAAGLVRDVAANSFALVVNADGSVVLWGPDADGQAVVTNARDHGSGGDGSNSEGELGSGRGTPVGCPWR